MKNLKFYPVIIIIAFLTLPGKSFGQTWMKTFYSSSYDLYDYTVREAYDNGYLLGAVQGSAMRIGKVIKTDINGNVLWEKNLGDGHQKWALHGMDVTPDGGVIIAGVCDTLDLNFWDPFIVKLNSCGDIQWCHVFHTNQNADYGITIRSLPDNTFVFLLKDWGLSTESNVCLMHLDMNGNVIWEQQYFQSDPLVIPFNETALYLTSDNKYLVTGTCFRPVSGQTTPNWLWPMLVLADSTGNAVCEIPWGYTLPFGVHVGGEGYQSVMTNNAVYSSISYYHHPDTRYSPCLIKTSPFGTPLSYHDLTPNSDLGKATTILKVSDSVLIVGGGYVVTGLSKMSVFKTDTLGTILKEKILKNYDWLPMDAIVTQDHKYLTTAWDNINNKNLFYLWKLNEDLEYDSIYTQPRLYDSLCPHAITSSTLFFQCDLITGMIEPVINTEKVKMHIYPNPGSNIIHVEMPSCIQKQTKTEHLNVITIFHQWYNDLDIEVYDLFGKLIYRQMVKPLEKELDLNISGWSRGMYYVRLSSGGTVVATNKLIVN